MTQGKEVDIEVLIVHLEYIMESVKSHYEHPIIAPNGKAEGLCLSVRGLKGIIKSLKEQH